MHTQRILWRAPHPDGLYVPSPCAWGQREHLDCRGTAAGWPPSQAQPLGEAAAPTWASRRLSQHGRSQLSWKDGVQGLGPKRRREAQLSPARTPYMGGTPCMGVTPHDPPSKRSRQLKTTEGHLQCQTEEGTFPSPNPQKRERR